MTATPTPTPTPAAVSSTVPKIPAQERYSFRTIMRRRFRRPSDDDSDTRTVVKAFASVDIVTPYPEADTEIVGFALVPPKRKVTLRDSLDEMVEQLVDREAYFYVLDQPFQVRDPTLGYLIHGILDDSGQICVYSVAKSGVGFHTWNGYYPIGVAIDSSGTVLERKQSKATMDQQLRGAVDHYELDIDWEVP